MPRWANRRDANEPGIFQALLAAGCEPVRLRDIDIVARHFDGHGVLLEVKVAKGKLRDVQVMLRDRFPGRYFIVRTPEAALAACGRSCG